MTVGPGGAGLAETNLKSGGEGHRGNFFWSCPFTFLALKVQLVVSVSALVMVSTVWSVSCLLFFYSRCPRTQPFVKVGARAPVPYGVGAPGRPVGPTVLYILDKQRQHRPT